MIQFEDHESLLRTRQTDVDHCITLTYYTLPPAGKVTQLRSLGACIFGMIAIQLMYSTPVRADAVADFYSGKTIRIINWSAPGGEYDLHGRLFAKYLGQYIPGKPTVIQENMPGAGGLTAANYLYNAAKHDGTVLGLMNNALPLFQTFGAGGAHYDAARLNWIGTITSPIVEQLIVWHSAPIKSYNDLLTTEMVIGTTGRDNLSYMIPVTMNALLGTRIKALIGYRGGEEVNLAIERGEIMGRINSWTGMKATNPEWIREKMVNILVQSSLVSPPDLKTVPLLIDLAKNDDDRTIFRMFAATDALGRPLATTPDVPADRLRALHAAFTAMMNDHAFVEEATKLQFDVSPIGADEMNPLVNEILMAPKPLVARLKEIVE